jgi:hypothetical protein
MDDGYWILLIGYWVIGYWLKVRDKWLKESSGADCWEEV